MLGVAVKTGSRNMLMDERTTRMICEEPSALAKHISREFRKEVKVDWEKIKELNKLVGKVIFLRSTELVIVAYEKGYFAGFGEMKKNALEASLYSLKFAGASTGFREISTYIKSLNGTRR